MNRLPYTMEVKLKDFSPATLDCLVERPFCFFLDSAGHSGKNSRYSFLGIDPVRTFSSAGGFITIDGHTFIDSPTAALKNFEASISNLPFDPYLPLNSGLVGFLGHDWPGSQFALTDACTLPDAWFGLYDTILTFDHLEESCYVSSIGLTDNGETDLDVAKYRCERLIELVRAEPVPSKERYIIKPLIPDPVSNFTEGTYVKAVEEAKRHLDKREWQQANLAQRFYAPVATNAWSIHKLLREKNRAPFASFMRCGNFELLSTSPSCFLKIYNDELTCNVIQQGIARVDDPVKDRLNQEELLHTFKGPGPAVKDDEHSLKRVLSKRHEISPLNIESDARAHYLVSRIQGKKMKGVLTADCLTAALPGASMTGVPKRPVNTWLKQAEPARRHVYTGSMGYIDSKGNAQFNMAVRTMIVKDQLAYVHHGQQVDHEVVPEEAFHNSRTNMNRLFEEIRGLGF